MSELISMMICINNPDNGMPTDRICGINFYAGDRVEIESTNIDGERYGLTDVFRIHRKSFRYRGRRTWVGNRCWDSIGMTPETLAELLNHLRAAKRIALSNGETCPRWQCTCAPTPIFEKWNTSKPFTAADLVGEQHAAREGE